MFGPQVKHNQDEWLCLIKPPPPNQCGFLISTRTDDASVHHCLLQVQQRVMSIKWRISQKGWRGETQTVSHVGRLLIWLQYRVWNGGLRWRDHEPGYT